MQPIATRSKSDDLTDGNLVKWDATANKLVDQGDYLSNDIITIDPGKDLTNGGNFTLNQHEDKKDYS